MTKAKAPPRSQTPLAARPSPPQVAPPQPESPVLDEGLSAAVAAAKKKKKKGKGKKTDDELLDSGNLIGHHHHAAQPTSNGPFSATAQAQADLLATASDLYRRIEADPQGIPDDDAYWTSLPSHLRTFIRNALPIGQLPASAQNDVDDPTSRQASTQAMIAVAQQLAQAAHASQRHLQQHPPASNNSFQHHGNNVAYPPFPFDPSVFADLALQTEQALPLHPHPNSTLNGGGYQYSNNVNPPPTQPPGEPLPAPVVLVNEYEEEAGEFDDDYYSDEDMDHHEAGTLDSRDGTWSHELNSSHANGLVAKTPSSGGAKKKNKKKKKKGGTEGGVNNPTVPLPPSLTAPLPPPAATPRLNNNPAVTNAPYSNAPTTPGLISHARSTPQPPPSSRAAGKQPMTFSSAGSKAPASTRAVNGIGHAHSHGPLSNAMGKRPASATASSHGHGSVNGGGPAQSATRAWSSSSVEERERIKEFWLALKEKDRKNLIKIEKDGVLKKMKEQQKHGCSCAVCGRKRNSIEDELEVLYDAYYDELELYASHQQKYVESGGQLPPPPGPGPFPGSVALDSQGAVIGGNAVGKQVGKRVHQHTHPPPPLSRTKAALPPEDDEAYDEDLDDEEYEDEYEYEDEEDEEEELDEPDVKAGALTRRRADAGGLRANSKASNDLFNFGSSLTVKGGILTVADDLLKNDGQKFLEMMEQLAERRALREEEVQAELDNASDEEDLEEEDEDEDEDIEENALTDEQRMEEGRRMFQIFAARMFEQRVLQAYREKVAQERQLQLLRELEEEDMAEKEREAKKAKENQKKKDKKKQAKQQKEEERIKIENEKAAEEAAAKAKLERQREAELKKQEEIRLKREAEKRLKDEEKARKEEERRRRQDEERARELEKERKRREKEEKVRMDREAREREAKAKEDEDRRAKEELSWEAERAAARRETQQKAARNASPVPSVPASPSAAKVATASTPRSPSSTLGASPLSLKADAMPSVSPAPPSAIRPVAPPTAPTAMVSVGSTPRGPAGAIRPAAVGAPVPSPSSLPAPPQGLPPRPTTNHTAHAQSGSLPRPPVSLAASGSSALQSSAPSLPYAKPVTVNAPASSQAPLGRYPMMTFGSSGSSGNPATRSPPSQMSSNGFTSTTGSSGTKGFDAVLGSPSSINATASGLASLSMSGMPSSTTAAPSQMPIGPIGGAGMSASNVAPPPLHHSRASSMSSGVQLDDYARQPSGSSIGRPISRPAPGPIGPIGRPRDLSHDDLGGVPSTIGGMGSVGGGLGSGMSSSIFGSGPMQERILGSSALGGDDELVEPQPRRTSHIAAPLSNASSFFGTGAFGAPSPWASSFAASGSGGAGTNGSGAVPRTPSTSNPSSMLHGLTSPSSASANAPAGMQPPLSAGVDPWARAQNSWDRARFAFEQPSAQQPSSQQHQQQTPVGAPPLSPFGAPGQHPLRGMFGAPGASTTSPHRHANDRGL